jgi:CheY-like chemotaxis protein
MAERLAVMITMWSTYSPRDRQQSAARFANIGDFLRSSSMTLFEHLVVVVAEDDPDMRELLRVWIEAMGARVVDAGDGANALHHARQEVPDVIVTDLKMPGVDGWSLLRFVRSERELSQVPVVAISGDASREMLLKTLQAGFSGYLVKPVSKATLEAELRRILPAQA